jgi:drug/metabolite transporter (DMT)-like permease
VFRDRRSALAAALVALPAFAWGFWPWVLSGPAAHGLAALQVALIVMTVQAVPAPFLAWRDRAAFRDRGAMLALLGFGVLDGAQCALYFPALTRGPVSVAALTHYLGPVIIALAAPFVPGERGSKRAMVAAPLSLFGLFLVMDPSSPQEAPWVTAALGVGSAFMGAGCFFTLRRASRSFSPLAVSALHAAISAAFLLAVFRGAAVPAWGPGVPRVLVAGLVLGIGATLVFVRAVKRVAAPIAATITYVEPVTAAAVGALLLGEHVGRLAILGAAIVVGAGVWVAAEAPPPSPTATPMPEAPRKAA